MQINVRPDVKRFKRALKKVHRKQIPFAFFRALNDTAFDAMKDTRKVMLDSFDIPIAKYLASGIVVQKAKLGDKNIDKMVARVDIADKSKKGQPITKLLTPHIDGGSRTQKLAERVLVGSGDYLYPARGTIRNSLGNLKTAEINKAIKVINRNVDTKPQGKRKKKPAFYPIKSKGRTIIMKRQGNTGTPFLIEGRKPTYRKRFDFYGAVERSVRENFNENMDKRLRAAINKPRKK